MERHTNVKLTLILFALFFFVASGKVSRAGTKDAKVKEGPSLVIAQPTFEAGKVLEGDEVVHTFIVQNKGSEDLVIKNVKPG
jgi:hypothetical protein